MRQNEKDLLLTDLCGRLPYKVKAQIPDEYGGYTSIIESIDIDGFVVDFEGTQIEIECIKPYLFPLSSMTEEQKYDFYCRFIENDCDFDDFKEFYLDNGMWHKLITSLDDVDAIIDWFHKNHFDYRGLIPKGLAIDATGKNIY